MGETCVSVFVSRNMQLHFRSLRARNAKYMKVFLSIVFSSDVLAQVDMFNMFVFLCFPSLLFFVFRVCFFFVASLSQGSCERIHIRIYIYTRVDLSI